MIFQRLLAVVGLALAVSACQGKPNKGETTPPTITITLMDKLGNQVAPFSPASTYNSKFVFSGNNGVVQVDPNLDILIVISATDPGGMNTLTGSISYFANCAQGVGGGVFATLTGINETATNNPPNTVTNTLPFLYEVKSAQLKTAQSQNCANSGTPNGLGSVVVQVAATNQSNKSVSVKEYIHTVGGVIPQ